MTETTAAAIYQPGSDEDFNRLYRDSHARILRTLPAPGRIVAGEIL